MQSTLFSIGLTGGIGSGKTTVSDMFAKVGAHIIDTDLIAHQLTAPNGKAIEAIIAAFGEDIVDSSGAMDRQKMRRLVFKEPTAKRQLEAILHPMIRSECEQLAASGAGSYPIFVVPLLVESGNWHERVTRILVIDCDEQTQIKRVMMRNGFPREQVEDIMQVQASRDERLGVADDVINSDENLDQIWQQVNDLHQKYLKLAQAC